MDGSRDDEGDATAAERVDRRQLLLVACCLGAVLVAAALDVVITRQWGLTHGDVPTTTHCRPAGVS